MTDLALIVQCAAANTQLVQKLADLYKDLSSQQDAAEKCNRCGRCCDFIAYGHRLYVTPIELAYLRGRTPWPRERPALRSFSGAGSEGEPIRTCPYQIDGQCTAHDRRTLGCRVFFCRADSRHEQEIYERFHARLRRLHEDHAIEYRYEELTQALQKIKTPAGV